MEPVGWSIEDRLPRAAGVGGFPDAAVVDADVEDIGLGGDAGGADGAAGAERADVAPLEGLVGLRRKGLRLEGEKGKDQEETAHNWF